MKKCPYCAEFIKDEAIVCRYCGRDIKTKTWNYRTYILHFRNSDEAGWMIADNEPAALINQYFFNQWSDLISNWDMELNDEGWEIAEPRTPACFQVEHTRNNTQAILSLITGSDGGRMWTAWARTCTLRYKRSSEKSSNETWNYWINIKTKKWERMEQDSITQKWYIWRRPQDYDINNPDDDRWEKIPI